MRFANTAFRRPWRLASSTVCSAVALLSVGCGGGGTSADDLLPRDVAASLAAETAEVEDALAASDHAAAREEALDLRNRVNAAIEAGDIPARLQRPLLAAVNRLIESIPEEEPPPEDEEEEEEKEEDKGKEEEEEDKGKGKGKNGDKEGATITDVTTVVATVTDGSGDG